MKKLNIPSLSSPVIFLLIGFLMTVCFALLPLIYDPIIIKALPITPPIVKTISLNPPIVKTLPSESPEKEGDISQDFALSQNQDSFFSHLNVLQANLAGLFRKNALAKTNNSGVQKDSLIGAKTAIKITWIVFIFFFFFPLAVMLPLHWYERGKIRKAERKIPGSPKVSLIFPAYNEGKFIQKTIEQGLKQDYKGEIEIVIVDDGSTDRTFEIANNFVEQYQSEKIPAATIKIYKHEKNLGKPAALNTGFQKATGEISIFSDSDSYLASDLVNKMVPHFDNPQIGMVAGMVIIDNEVNLLTKMQQIEYLYNQEIVRFCQETHKGVLICPGAATAVRTHIARDIPSTERTVTEDADFTFEVAKAGWKIGQEPEAITWTDAPENWKELINQRKLWLNGELIAENNMEQGYLKEHMLHIPAADINNHIVQGENILVFEVKNWKLIKTPPATFRDNPGGLIYKFYINGDCAGRYFKEHCMLWREKDLTGNETFFNFDDVKPGDWGTNIISLHVFGNNAYSCLLVTDPVDNENTLTGPELKLNDTVATGELSQFLSAVVWVDNTPQNNQYDAGETILYGPKALKDIKTMTRLPLTVTTTAYVGLAWCLGTQTIDQVNGIISCSGAGNQDIAQTDIFLASLTAYAEQQRNNDNFSCAVVQLP